MNAVFHNLDMFWSGIKLTLELTVMSSVLAFFLGTCLAAARVSPVPLLRVFGRGYVEIIRNMPLVVIFFFAAFGLPSIGIRYSYFTFAVLALTVYYTAYFCEAVRSGINTVAVGQIEAGRSIGFTFLEMMRFIVLPQALRSVVPPLINVFIALVKNSAVASAFGVAELFTVMEHLANDESDSVLAILFVTAIFYLSITVPAGLVAGHIERKWAIKR